MEKDIEVHRPLLDREGGELQATLVQRQGPWQFHLKIHIWSWCAQLLLFTASIAMMLIASQPPVERCVEKLSAYSPALEAVGDDYRWCRLNGSITRKSPYKGRPIGAVLQAWEDLTSERSFSIDHPTLKRIGAPESAVRLPEEIGGGYMAGLEMYHQIHCVKALWQNTWPDFYHPDAGTESAIHRQHLDHCADLLRQKLMCDGDVGVVTMNWVEHMSHPTPNFNTLHKCRRWEDIQAWAVEHEVAAPSGGELLRPHDAVVLEDLP